ncbi:hypothetical protein SteCoe_8655 [Stentor coeruleus]|uniref:Transmembrane protein n=1 Tax=Stentor coeruleus TaxID=5963 RepID=A0A1R2CJT8_9CILI|nr:hypothetical protein SteCoe_8655 [Stentor coeruleus]
MIVGQPVASLTLQILLYGDGLYNWAYLLLQLALFVYRGYTYNYKTLTIGFELLGVFLLFLLQMIRIFIGSVGNKTEEIVPLLYMLLLTIPTALGALYFLGFQTYVLIADIIINIALLVFMILEVLLSLIAMIRFKGSEKNQ